MTLRLGAVLALLTCAGGTALAQGAGTLSPGARGYTWTRGNHSFELRNRSRDWTAAEAATMKAALDKLPDVLLDYATQLGVTQLRRDDRPRKSLSLKTNGLATTVVEAKWISFGDVLFQRPASRIYQTVTHELGHVAQYGLTGRSALVALFEVRLRGTRGFSELSWSSILLNGLRRHNGFVSAYARTNHREDFAESVEFYWIHPAELLRVNPAKFQFMRDVVFKQVASPTSSQDPTHRAINPVLPVIQSLGDPKDDPFSLVRIRGQYFMAFKDGGRNRVEYRGKKALTLPISRKTIYSWVPWLSPGSAPITVETPDGASAPYPFEVTKPWWKLW